METNRFPIFSKRFRELRGDKTQAEFAEELGLSRPTVGYYENGTRIPDALTLKQIAEKSCITTDYLVGLTNSPERSPAAVDELGLTQDAIESLRKMKCWDVTAVNTVNWLLTTYRAEPWDDVIEMVSNLDRDSALGALTAYLNQLQISKKNILLTKNGELIPVGEQVSIDLRLILGSYSSEEVSDTLLEKQVLLALKKLKQAMQQYTKDAVDSLRAEMEELKDGDDPEAR